MNYFDTHAHLSMVHNAEEALKNARDHGIGYLVTVSTEPSNWDANRTYAKASQSNPESLPHVFYSLGLHPNASLAWAKEKASEKLRGYFDDNRTPARCVAIGEIGLDYYFAKEESERELQRTVFSEQLQFAKSHSLPVIIHCRDGFEDVFQIVRQIGLCERGSILHCFTGTSQEADKALELGFYISFSGIVTFRNAKSLKETSRRVPLNKLLIETDCPFLAPEPFRGKPNEPMYVIHTARALSELMGVAPEKLRDQTTENAFGVFDIHAHLRP